MKQSSDPLPYLTTLAGDWIEKDSFVTREMVCNLVGNGSGAVGIVPKSLSKGAKAVRL